MKCLIIAAGQGSRLCRKGNPKPLIPLLGIPLTERVIRSAVQVGIDDLYVVSGYKGDQVRHFLDGLASRCKIAITHVVNEDWAQENGLSVLKAREYLSRGDPSGNEPFLLLMADHLFDPAILRDLIAQPPGMGEITLAVDSNTANPLVDLGDVTRVKCENGRLLEIGKGLPVFNGFDTGIFLCTPAVFGALERSVAERGDTSLTGGVRCLATAYKVNVMDIGDRFWIDVDDRRTLRQAERALLSQLGGKPNDGPVSRYLNRPLSIRISRYLTRLPLTPNQISLISFFGSLLAAVLFAAGGYLALAAGGVLAQLASVIDGCDGEVARLKFQVSDYGGWFDAVLDRYADAFLLFGLTWHSFADGANMLALFVGFLAIIGSFVQSYTADKYDGIMRARFTSGRSLRIGRDIRIFLVFLGALLNQPFWALLVIATLMNGDAARRMWVCRNHG